jgi:hypothetical protein
VIGSKFTPSQISVVLGKTEEWVKDSLVPAIDSHFIVAGLAQEHFRFVHDNVLVEVYQLTGEPRTKQIHLALGRFALAAWRKPKKHAILLFDALSHMNEACESITD